MMQYGFQRLVLLNSAGYARAELPLDGAVSLVAPNNTGKTSLINALQYLLIIDRRRMDFGAHDVDKSRRFYFPHNSAYILLEVYLPEAGTVVLGCVGKGVSYEYEYFAYAGPLDIDEFRLPDGSLVAQPQLASHLATRQRRVFSYPGSGEFRDMVYGARNRRQPSTQDFCVFRLEHPSDADAFQRVLTRTLRLDKLRSAEVKDYLLQIFRRDLSDANIDFKAEWDKAFAEVNAERAQYLAAVRLKPALAELERHQDERLVLRGKLQVWKPLIEEGLQQWQSYFAEQQRELQAQLDGFDKELRRLLEQDREATRQQTVLQLEEQTLRQAQSRQQALAQRFALIPSLSELQQRRAELIGRRNTLIVRIGQVESRESAAIRRELQRLEQELVQLERELHTQGHNLYLQLAEHLTPVQLAALNKVFGRSVLSLGVDGYTLESNELKRLLAYTSEANLVLPGLQLNLKSLPIQFQQRTLLELHEQQQEFGSQQQSLQEQLATAEQLADVRKQCADLEKQITELDAEIREYEALIELQQGEAARRDRLAELAAAQAELAGAAAQMHERHAALTHQQQLRQQELVQLQTQHRQIEQRRNQRIDHEGQFAWLAELPHHPWLAQPQWPVAELAERLQTYLVDCRRLLELDDKILHLLAQIHGSGLNKYEYLGDTENEIARLIEFCRHLPQEEQALERKARSAVVNVAACLRELRDGLLSFKRRMREFNRKIAGCKLSDLAVFKIEPEDEIALVEAIELLISTAATVESGETFELFNQQSVLDDDQLNRAKTLLIDEGSARHGLRVADLFRLRFWVGKAGREEEAFDDLDSAASNGTVLMAKLVTGLAMLHMMQDQRRPIQGVCYLDEALALDARNQRSLIDTAAEFGFSLIFASPAPLTTVRYVVPIRHSQGANQIGRTSWQILEPLETP